MSGRRLSTRGGRRRAAAGGGRRAASCERDGTGRKHDAVAACAKARTGRAIANGSWHARRTAPKRTALRQPVAPNRIRRDGRDGKPRTASKRRADGLLPSPSMLHKQSDSVIEQSGPFRRTAAYGPLWPIPLGFLRACIRPTDLLGSRQSDTGREGGGSSWDGRNAREPGGPRGGNSAREWATPQDKRNAKTARAAPGSPAGGCSAWDFGRHGG